jgi:hypothetical protein
VTLGSRKTQFTPTERKEQQMKICNTRAVAAAALSLASFLGLATSPRTAAAAENPWVGTWKLDLAKSNFTGDTFTYAKNGDLYHFSDGSTTNYDFGIDGKAYSSYADRMTTWNSVNDHAWDAVTKTKDGQVLYKVHRELSSGGKTLTLTATGTKPDGSTFNETSVYTRIAGTDGLVGKWRSVKSNSGSPEKFVISSPTPGVLHWEIPDYKQSVEGKPDGSDLPMGGPTVTPGTTISIKSESPTKMSYIIKVNGKAEDYGVTTLAADGRSYTDVSWSPGKENEKSTGVYIRQ